MYGYLCMSTRRCRVGGCKLARPRRVVLDHVLSFVPPPPSLLLEMALENTPPAFFAGSDDEDMEDAQAPLEEPVPQPAESSLSATEARSPTQKPLFFADSDDEESSSRYNAPNIALAPETTDESELDLDVEMPEFVDVPRASSESSTSSGPIEMRDSSPLPQPLRPSDEERPPKRRKMSPAAGPSQARAAPGESMYLGSFLVDKAWSTVKGSGYIKPGEEVRIEREEINKPPPPPPAKKTAKGKGGKKQITIASMFKPAPPKVTKKKQDSVVILTNTRGFGKP